jgi:hypothetical protein
VTSRPLSLNPYAWVEGNVVNAVDPSGLLPDWYPEWMKKVAERIEQMKKEALQNTPKATNSPIATATPAPTAPSISITTSTPISPINSNLPFTPTPRPVMSSTPIPTRPIPAIPTPYPTPTSIPNNPAFNRLQTLKNQLPEEVSEEPSNPRVLVLGWRVDATSNSQDVNLELQIVPHHLSPEYWGKRYVMGIMVNYGVELSTSIGGNITTGPIWGHVDSSSIGSQSQVGGNFTVGGGKVKVPIFGPVAEGDLGVSESGWLGYVSLGADAGDPLPLSGYVGTFNTISLNDFIADWFCRLSNQC